MKQIYFVSLVTSKNGNPNLFVSKICPSIDRKRDFAVDKIPMRLVEWLMMVVVSPVHSVGIVVNCVKS